MQSPCPACLSPPAHHTHAEKHGQKDPVSVISILLRWCSTHSRLNVLCAKISGKKQHLGKPHPTFWEATPYLGLNVGSKRSCLIPKGTGLFSFHLLGILLPTQNAWHDRKGGLNYSFLFWSVSSFSSFLAEWVEPRGSNPAHYDEPANHRVTCSGGAVSRRFPRSLRAWVPRSSPAPGSGPIPAAG